MRACGAIVAIALAACQFDESGVPGLGSPDGAAPAADAGAPDAGRIEPPDAAEPCTDRDDDGWVAVGIEDSDCGPILDCDDDDDRAFPGQTEYFTTARTSGGFDFDCDGEESKIDDTQGGECAPDWWSCGGTGWVGGVPDCGDPGTWHTCEDQQGCNETSSQNISMACR